MEILFLNMRIATIVFGLLWLVISLSYYRQGKLKFSTRTIILCFYFFDADSRNHIVNTANHLNSKGYMYILPI